MAPRSPPRCERIAERRSCGNLEGGGKPDSGDASYLSKARPPAMKSLFLTFPQLSLEDDHRMALSTAKFFC